MALKQKPKKPVSDITPPPSTDFQIYFVKYMEEKFLRLHEKIEDIEVGVKELGHIVDTMIIKDGQHYQLCPNTIAFKSINDEINDFKFIKRYWKVFLIAAAVTFIGFMYTGFKTWEEYKSLLVKRDSLKMEIQTNKSLLQENENKYKEREQK